MRPFALFLILASFSSGALEDNDASGGRTRQATSEVGPLVCDELVHDFGALIVGDKEVLRHQFAVTNVSDRDVWVQKRVGYALYLRPPTYFIPAGQTVRIPVELRVSRIHGSFQLPVRLTVVDSPDSLSGIPE